MNAAKKSDMIPHVLVSAKKC